MARPGLTGHRKFRRLARALGSSLLARGALELLWDSCYESGEEYVGTSEDIETLVEWTGERGMLTRALVEAGAPEGHGFLEPVSDAVGEAVAYRVHDLWHHAPDYVAKRRKRELDRQQKSDPKPARQPDRRTAPNGDGSGRTPTCLIEVDRTPSPSPSHSPSHQKKNGSSETSEPVFLAFPTNGPVSEWTLTKAQVAEWVELYPGVDVSMQARQALAWLRANKGRRKTAAGMPRFFVNWLNRENDKGGRTLPAAHSGSVNYEWTCPHEPKCLGRHACQVKQTIAAGKAS